MYKCFTYINRVGNRVKKQSTNENGYRVKYSLCQFIYITNCFSICIAFTW
jgi:hypothetical protein